MAKTNHYMDMQESSFSCNHNVNNDQISSHTLACVEMYIYQ